VDLLRLGFFQRFVEIFSSFFLFLIFLFAGSSFFVSLIFASLFPLILGTDEDSEAPLYLFALQGTFSS